MSGKKVVEGMGLGRGRECERRKCGFLFKYCGKMLFDIMRRIGWVGG